MSTRIFTGVELSLSKLQKWGSNTIIDYQFLAGTKNIWCLSFWMDCLPVLGQLTLRLVRSARLFGRVLPLYTCPILCFSIGPSSNITETAMSCVAPHLLQRAKRLYWTAGFLVGDGIECCMPSFSCMMHRYCLLLLYFGQDWISTRTVDKAVHIAELPYVAPRPERRVTDCLVNEQ